jgi:hypothetical protein
MKRERRTLRAAWLETMTVTPSCSIPSPPEHKVITKHVNLVLGNDAFDVS